MLTASSLPTIIAALAGVIGAIILLSKGARSSGLVKRLAGQSGTGHMAVRDSVALDRLRRLHLVRCGDRDVLLLTGGSTDVVVGWMPSGEAGAPL